MPKPILIDTDTGVDDALALILAFRSPELSVKAITTVAGNIEVHKCTSNVHRVLDLLHTKDRPIVAQGAKHPLRRPLVIASEVHGSDGLGGVSQSLPPVKPYKLGNGVDTILDFCDRYGSKGTMVAIGPLTNLALALKSDKRIVCKVGHIVTMGGAFRVPGNTGPVAEFNYYVDPEAAHAVLNADIPVTVIPLDVTHQVVLMRKEMEYRAARRASAVAMTILKMTRDYMLYHLDTQGFNGGYLHDPMAVAVAAHPGLVKTRRTHVDVEAKGEYTRGMTVTDFKERRAAKRGNVHVALTVERDRFLRLFHERLWM
ncbi:MAG: nucleoside hydrolase [Ignavibacteriales bacterium]|nr:nucleoside hydrolase [Ignavibacteriales bacterium]